jgi:hypothetical protein
MMLGVVHIEPIWTLSAAALMGGLLLLFWMRLGADDVLPARRRVRRWTVAIGFFLLLLLVRGLSFVDPDVRQYDYVLTWTMVLVCVLGLLLTAGADVLVTLFKVRRQAEAEMGDAGRALAEALRAREQRKE